MIRSASAEFSQLLRDGVRSIPRSNALIFELPPSLRKPHILTAYRYNYSLRECLGSLFEWHNETFNVWTHVFGCAYFSYGLLFCASDALLNELPPHARDIGLQLERWPLYVFVVSALCCLCASVAYHLCGTANERWVDRYEHYDYMGIIALIVGSCCPVVHFGFGSSLPQTRFAYTVVILALGTVMLCCSGTAWFERRKVCFFLALGLCGVVALLHAMVARDFSPITTSLVCNVLVMGFTYLAGVGIYATHVPERFSPKRFDILGSSHQLWHACVLIAAAIHFRAVLGLWRSTAIELALRA